MAFTGTYKLQKTEFYNEYLKALSKLKLIQFQIQFHDYVRSLGYKGVFYISYFLMIEVSRLVNFTYISLQIFSTKTQAVNLM